MKRHERQEVGAACCTDNRAHPLPAQRKQCGPFRHLTLVSQGVQKCTGHGKRTREAAPELLRGRPCPRLKQLSKVPPSCAKQPRLHIFGGHSAPEKPGTHARQTTSNAALGLPVSLCWLKLLLASALAFNFSPLNNPLDLPPVVFLTGAQRARNKMVQSSMHP